MVTTIVHTSNDGNLRTNLEAQVSTDKDKILNRLQSFVPRLLAIAERRISSQLQRKFDADDVVASLCRSIVRRRSLGKFEFEDNEDLWKIIVIALKRKIFNKVRDEETKKRDHRLETSMQQNEFLAAISKRPDPSDAVEFEELMLQIRASIDQVAQNVFECKLSGMNNREIARHLKCSERQVGRKLVLIRETVRQILHE